MRPESEGFKQKLERVAVAGELASPSTRLSKIFFDKRERPKDSFRALFIVPYYSIRTASIQAAATSRHTSRAMNTPRRIRLTQ